MGMKKSQNQDDGERACRPIRLLSVLEAENIRLRQAVVELLIDTLALREALQGRVASAPWRGVDAKRSACVVQLRPTHDAAVTAVASGRAGAVVADVFPDLEQCGGLASRPLARPCRASAEAGIGRCRR
jgi:hypothetical protein